MLLPLSPARTRSISLQNHLALAAMRSGNGNVNQMSCLLKTVYLSHFLSDAVQTGIHLDAFRLCEAALQVSAASAPVGQGWTLPDDTHETLATILALHDQQLASVSAHQFATAWERLERFLASAARSPLPPA
jgi:hypothetical protein